MRSLWKRLFLAACLSLACAGATIGWYYETAVPNTVTNEPPLAQAAATTGEVLRRPPTRLLWQSVSTGDSLYNGETIRTADEGELRIQFEDGRYIQLEPESLIVLEKKQGQINLDLLDGSAFVNAKAATSTGAAPGMVLQSAAGKVDLTNASASLSKSAGNRIDLRVLAGKAKVKGKDGKEHDVESGKATSIGTTGPTETPIAVLTPAIGRPVYINAETQTPVQFKWQGYPANWRVGLLVGSTRRTLKEVAHAEPNSPAQISAQLPLGKVWWQLAATDPSTKKTVAESPINRLEVRGRFPPTLLVPHPDGVVPVEKSPSTATFEWRNEDDVRAVKLEISQDPDMKKVLFEKTFTRQKDGSLQQSIAGPQLASGAHYYARMSATYPESETPVTSKVRPFALQLPAKKDPVEIVWNVPPEKRDQVFGVQPQLEFSWESKNRGDEIAGYRVTVETEDHSDSKPLQLKVQQTSTKTPVAKAGRYIASVEAYDKSGETIGKSEPLVLTASAAPLLAPPILLPADGDLAAGADGRTELQWNPIPTAKEYWVTVENKSGKQLLHRKYETNSAKLKNLMPGEYSVKVMAVDEYGRNGHEATARVLKVPDGSNLKSPKLKKVQVD